MNTPKKQLLKTGVGVGLLALMTANDIAANPVVKTDRANTFSETEIGSGPINQHQSLNKQGVKIDFDLYKRNADGVKVAATDITEGDWVDIEFKITDSETGQPVRGIFPGAWMDVGQAWNLKNQEKPLSCKQRVGIYLQGTVGMRPVADFNSYYILALNDDATISVIDPLVGINGITKLYALINLNSPGADWVRNRDQNRMYVSMPTSNQIAVVDIEKFKLIENVDAGAIPNRVAIQPDGKYLWVGNNSHNAKQSGVTIIDTETNKPVKFLETGNGHHEIAFSDDSRFAYITNRHSQTVSVIDIAKLTLVTNIAAGEQPLDIAFSTLSKNAYVTDGATGKITVIDGQSHKVKTVLKTKMGLGPLNISQDGRWALAANTLEDVVYVIDTAHDKIAHTLEVAAKPYQISFSRAFAYIRSLNSHNVNLVELAHLNKSKPHVLSFPAGSSAPGNAKNISIASAMQEAPGEAAMLVVSQADNTVYYYMEGMNAPMGNFRNYGHRPQAVTIADRTLKESEPGVYSATVKIPAPGVFDVAMLMDSPQIVHCFAMEAKPNPETVQQTALQGRVDYKNEGHKVAASENYSLRFEINLPTADGKSRTAENVMVKYYRSPGTDLSILKAERVKDNLFEVKLNLATSGAYYIYVSEGDELDYRRFSYLTLQSVQNLAARD